MSNSLKRTSALIFALFFSSVASSARTEHQPLRDTEVLALVAGAALPSNIAHAIAVRGLDFAPDAAFRSRLKTACADALVFTALKTAKITPSGALNDEKHRQLLQRLATAAQLMNAKNYDAAAAELNQALENGPESPAVGFAMGEVLRATERHSEAVAVYAEVLKQNPDFPDAHTKLSYSLYRTDEAAEAMRQAKLALAANPGNPEAHENLALALESLRKVDSAIAEHHQALRLQPDYVNVLRSLGRYDDAAHLEKRAESIQSSSAQTGSN